MLYSILLCWLVLLTRIWYGAAASDRGGMDTVVGSRYPDMCGVVGAVFHWTIPVYDSSDSLHVARYGSVHLPVWLRLNNATLSGVPLHTDLGAVTLSVWVNNKFHMLVGLDVRPHHCPTALQPYSAFTTDYPLSNRVSCDPFTTKLIALVLCDAGTVAPTDRVGLLLSTASILTLHYSAVTLTSLSTALSTGHYYFLYTDTTIELNDTVAVLAELTCTVEDSKLWHAIVLHAVRAHNLTILLAEYTPLLPWVRRKRKITSPGSNQMLIHQPQLLEIDITETLDFSTTSSTLSITSSTVSMLTSSTAVSVTSTLFLITSSAVSTSSTELTGILTSTLFLPSSSTVTTSLVLPSSTVSTSLVLHSSSTVSTSSTEFTGTLISSLFHSSITVTSSLFLPTSSRAVTSLFIPTSGRVTTTLFIPTPGRVTTSSFLPTLPMTSVTVPPSSIFTNSSVMISSVTSSSVLSPIVLETTMLFPNTSILPSLSSIIAGFSSIVSSLSTVITPTPTPPSSSSMSSILRSISVESSILTHPTTITSSIPPITTSIVMISSTTLLAQNSSVFNFTSMLMSSSTLASTTRVMATRTHRSTPITTPIITPITTSIISTNILSTTPITSSLMSSLILSSISSPTMATQTPSISSLTFITPPNTTTIMATRTRSTPIATISPIITTIMATQRPITTNTSFMSTQTLSTPITTTTGIIMDTQTPITTILPNTSIMATQTLSTPITTTILPTSTTIMSTQTRSTPITTTILPTSTAIMSTQTLSTPITTTILPTSTAIMSKQTLSTPITTTILPTSTAIMSTQTLSTPITTTTIMSTQIPTTTPIIINNPPNLKESVKLRDITPGVPYNRSIAKVFSNETALSYTVMQLGDNPIPSWIELIDDSIILLAPIAEQGKYFYILLVAIDRSGMEAVDTIEIELLEIMQPLYTITISILTSLSLWDRYNIMTRIITLISDAGLVDYTTVRNFTNDFVLTTTTTLLKLFVIGGGQLDCDAQNETDLFRLIYNSTEQQYEKRFTMTIAPYEVKPGFLPDVTGNCVQKETDAPPTISISLSLEYDPTTFTISAVLSIIIAVLMICTCFLCLCCVYRYYRYQPLPSKERAAFQSRRPVVIDNDPSPTHKGRYVVVLNGDLEDSPQDTEASEPLLAPESVPVRRLPKLPKERPPPLFKLPSRLLVTDK